MVNVPLNFLWVFIVITFIILTIIVIAYLIRWSNGLEVLAVDTRKDCVVPIGSVPDITNNLCCFVGTTITASKYVPQINTVVNPVPTPYLPVCQGFCTNGVLADGMTCVDGVGQSEFNACINRSAPIDCNAIALPVAYAGNRPYYAFAATEASCPLKGQC